MKHILLLTDFSNNALNAIHYAMHFFKNETCTFHILNVHKVRSFISDDLMRSPKDSIYKTITKIPREKLEALVDDLKNEFSNPNHSFQILIDFDVFIDAVKQAVKSKNIEYIVMGTNGVTGAKEVFLGSNTIQVIRKLNCKTIAIPEGYQYKPFKELLLSLDPKDELTGDAFTELLEFIEIYKCHLHVLRINPNDEHSEKHQNDLSNLALIDCKYNVVNNVPIEHAINSYLQTNTIDFTALILHKESFFEHLFSNATTSKINLSKISLPLLVLH